MFKVLAVLSVILYVGGAIVTLYGASMFFLIRRKDSVRRPERRVYVLTVWIGAALIGIGGTMARLLLQSM